MQAVTPHQKSSNTNGTGISNEGTDNASTTSIIGNNNSLATVNNKLQVFKQQRSQNGNVNDTQTQ
jgi:hypothetical protein